jgi:N-6 DNA Methylase
MNMILHDNPTAEIKQSNTLANPLFNDDRGDLKTFDYVVANPQVEDIQDIAGHLQGGIPIDHVAALGKSRVCNRP